MLIWGNRGRHTYIENGEFNCPTCNARTSCIKIVLKKWFTLYFIPVFPYDTISEWIQCKTCKSDYKLEVLNFDPQAEKAKSELFLRTAFLRAIKNISYSIILFDGKIEQSELDVVQMCLTNFTKLEMDIHAIKEEVLAFKIQKDEVVADLKLLSDIIEERNKEDLVKIAYAVSTADGPMNDAESTFLLELGNALNMTQAHLKGVLSELQ